MSQEEGQGFLSRWSRRKAQVQQAEVATPAAASKVSVPEPPVTVRKEATSQGQAAAAGGTSSAAAPSSAPVGATPVATASSAAGSDGREAATLKAEAPPKPTLQDVERLDAQSDYRNFVARDVDPDVRNAAFKKLFHSDPHFNVMDGLDVYIDDYNTPNPLPVAIMKTLVQARAMGLIDDELKEQDRPAAEAVPASQGSAANGMPDGDGGPVGEAAQGSDAVDSNEPPLETPAAEGHPMVGDATVGAASEPRASGSSQAALVELVMVPDTASNDEPIRPTPATAIAAGTVVPFPRHPGSADPA